MEKNVQITIDVPDGYEFIGFRKVTYKERFKTYPNSDIMQTWNNSLFDSTVKVFVFKEKALIVENTKVGDVFKFKNPKHFPNRTFRRIGDCNKQFIICNDTGYIESFSDYDFLKEIEIIK